MNEQIFEYLTEKREKGKIPHVVVEYAYLGIRCSAFGAIEDVDDIRIVLGGRTTQEIPVNGNGNYIGIMTIRGFPDGEVLFENPSLKPEHTAIPLEDLIINLDNEPPPQF